jgi:hypothetical protein
VLAGSLRAALKERFCKQANPTAFRKCGVHGCGGGFVLPSIIDCSELTDSLTTGDPKALRLGCLLRHHRYLFGYVHLTNTRSLVGDLYANAYELLFSFSSFKEKQRFLELVHANLDMGNDYIEHDFRATPQLSQTNYSGTTTALSFGIASYTALSMFRCAITSSGGVCDSHSESDRSWYLSVLNISRNRRSVSPVFSM